MWVAVLDAAKDWGIPPWEIAGGNKLIWWERWVTRHKIEIKIAQQLAEQSQDD
jgi:hypothetical protein